MSRRFQKERDMLKLNAEADDFFQILSVAAFHVESCQLFHLCIVYPAIVPGYLFDAADFKALAFFYYLNEFACLYKRVECTCIEPCSTTIQHAYFQLALF